MFSGIPQLGPVSRNKIFLDRFDDINIVSPGHHVNIFWNINTLFNTHLSDRRQAGCSSFGSDFLSEL